MTSNYHFTKPVGPLSGFVERFWHLRDAPAHGKERIMPGGTMELVINLQEDEFRIYDANSSDRFKRFSGSVISGAHGRPFVIDTRTHAAIIGVHFRPGGAFPFLNAAAHELAGTHVDLMALWGQSAVKLRERLCAGVNPGERIRLLERALTAHLFKPLEHHPAVEFALHAFERIHAGPAVRDVAQAAGISHRRFIQIFEREVGLSPKMYSRLRRFQRTLDLAQRMTGPEWARLALDCEYCDQSHFIRDFQIFSGLSPKNYLRQRSENLLQNHVPVTG
jgi:AraC-like DNA-binding protein